MPNRGTKEGTEEEISLVKRLNKKDELNFWEILNINPSNHFAIHVVGDQIGKISGQSVKPKADAYIAKGEVPEDYLETHDFYLNEEDVNSFNLEPVDFTGISIKLQTSTNFQITKMSPNTFQKIFGNYELGAGASIYCLREDDLIKNHSVIKGWKTNEKDFIDFFKSENVITTSELNKESFKKIKNYSNKKITQIINEDKEVSDFIFQGIGNFEEPFTVHYLYQNGEFKNKCYIPFKVTHGSGRSRGDFTIVIKPK